MASDIIAFAATIGVSSASASQFDAASYNNPTAGPPTAWFSGANTVPVTQIASAAAAATQIPADASYILQNDGQAMATIKSDWSGLSKVHLLNKFCISPLKMHREQRTYGLPTWTSIAMA